jgi:hypothetical protein
MRLLQGAEETEENPEIPEMDELANFHNQYLQQPGKLDKVVNLVT